MFFSRAISRVSRSLCRSSVLISTPGRQQSPMILSNQLHFLVRDSPNMLVPGEAKLLFNSLDFSTPRFGFSSSASPEPSEKDQRNEGSNDPSANAEEAKASDRAKTKNQTQESGFNLDSQSQSVKRRRSGIKRTAFSDLDSEIEDDLSRDDLVKLVAEKEELLNLKQKEIEKMQDKVLRTYAEMENVMDRTRRQSEDTKKFAIQNFAKSLLDVADNMGRASSVVKESFSKLDVSKDSAGAVPLLKTLLEGLEMTEKQLTEVFKKFGLEKFNPINEPFDPNRHNAVFQVPDNSKPSGTVAAVLKAGYMLHDRVIRPAEVGVTQAAEDNGEA